jgi:hypothetical protein
LDDLSQVEMLENVVVDQFNKAIEILKFKNVKE